MLTVFIIALVGLKVQGVDLASKFLRLSLCGMANQPEPQRPHSNSALFVSPLLEYIYIALIPKLSEQAYCAFYKTAILRAHD